LRGHLHQQNTCAILHQVKLTAQVKLHPSPDQYQLLSHTLKEANAACNRISERAWTDKVFGQFSLQKLTYHPARERFALSAQMVVRAVAKVADSYKVSKKKQRGFKQYGAFPYDARILTFDLSKKQVSIWTTGGRARIPFVCGARATPGHMKGYTFGTSDVVMADIQSGGCPAT
jgi:predicted transposase